MIRQDYILRAVAELGQALTRALRLRHRREYDLALQEIDQALGRLRDAGPSAPAHVSLSDWIALCRRHEQAAAGLLVAVGDLLGEQGEILAGQDKPAESRRSRSLALGLLLEALLNGETFVTSDLLGRVEHLADGIHQDALPSGVSQRLVAYFIARGRFARAEDVLFRWLEAKDASAVAAGEAFYAELREADDEVLERGGLPRAEVEQGRKEFMEAARSLVPPGPELS